MVLQSLKSLLDRQTSDKISVRNFNKKKVFLFGGSTFYDTKVGLKVRKVEMEPKPQINSKSI